MFGLSQDNGYSSQHPRWVVGQIGADKPPAYPLRPVADRGRGDGSSPPAAWVVDRSFPLRKSLCVPAARLPDWILQAARYSVVGGLIFPLINRVSLKGQKGIGSQNIFQIFFHVLQGPAGSAGADRLAPVTPSAAAIALTRVAQHDSGIKYPAGPVIVWQTVQSVPQTIFKPLHALQISSCGAVAHSRQAEYSIPSSAVQRDTAPYAGRARRLARPFRAGHRTANTSATSSETSIN